MSKLEDNIHMYFLSRSKRIIMIGADGNIELIIYFMIANIANLNQASQKEAPHMGLHCFHIILYLKVDKLALSINKSS